MFENTAFLSNSAARFFKMRGGILTLADVEHSEDEERWFSIGRAGSGVLISVVYLWSDIGAQAAKIRIISARKATQKEIEYYQESL